MKIILGLLLLSVCACFAAAPTNAPLTVRVDWDASPDAGVTGYRVWWSTNSFYGAAKGEPLLGRQGAGTNCTATVSNLAPGARYYLVVTATNAAGLESDFSNEAYWDAPAVPRPPRVRVVVQVVLESTRQAGGPWQEEVMFPEYVAEAEGEEAMFFRARLTARRE